MKPSSGKPVTTGQSENRFIAAIGSVRMIIVV
jgi:hypothetical protein